MADLIKKIKIKKQDGTFTDYIPIGAEAQNVSTTDGDSVQLKLNKKPYYYNSVADMKADTKLKVGDMAVTLGYYEPNDGGHGEYIIVDDDSLIDDGGSIHALSNGLRAKLIINDKNINIKQFGITESHKNKNLSFENVVIDLSDSTIDYNTYTFTNCVIKNGTIIANDDNTINMLGSITLNNISIINDNNTGDTQNNMMNTNFTNSDTIIIENCTFKNYGFHFMHARNIDIRNNLFYGTLLNNYGTVASKECLHVTNKDLILENCNIENNVFKGFQNDCIDLYPHGNNTSIKNNTFYNCSKAIEIKAENRDSSISERTHVPIHSCVVQGNYFRDIPIDKDNVVCIIVYCNDDTQTDNYTLYPHIVIDSNFFCNDLGSTNYRPIRLKNINGIIISNCRTNKGNSNVSEQAQFVYSIESNAIINNCMTTMALTGDPDKKSIFHISNCIGGNVGGAKSLFITNSQVENITGLNNPNVQFVISNVICPTNNLEYKGGLGVVSNSIFRSFNNGFTEDSTTTNTNYVSINNCFYTTQLATNTANFVSTNCHHISSSAVKYITDFN